MHTDIYTVQAFKRTGEWHANLDDIHTLAFAFTTTIPSILQKRYPDAFTKDENGLIFIVTSNKGNGVSRVYNI